MTLPEVPATLDELAALYLRARDVPCPGCQFNRRDGATAACPECGHDVLVWMDTKGFAAVLGWVRLRLIAALLAAVAVGIGAGSLYELWQLNNALVYFPTGTASTTPWQLYGVTKVLLGASLLGSAVALAYALRTLLLVRRSPKNLARRGRALQSATVWLLLATFPPVLDKLLWVIEML